MMYQILPAIALRSIYLLRSSIGLQLHDTRLRIVLRMVIMNIMLSFPKYIDVKVKK